MPCPRFERLHSRRVALASALGRTGHQFVCFLRPVVKLGASHSACDVTLPEPGVHHCRGAAFGQKAPARRSQSGPRSSGRVVNDSVAAAIPVAGSRMPARWSFSTALQLERYLRGPRGCASQRIPAGTRLPVFLQICLPTKSRHQELWEAN